MSIFELLRKSQKEIQLQEASNIQQFLSRSKNNKGLQLSNYKIKLGKHLIRLGNKKLNRKDWMFVFQKIQKNRKFKNAQFQQSFIQRLYLDNNNKPNIIQSIKNINFSRLVKLDLAANKICNIQALSILKVQNLRELLLYRNCISCVKSLSKWNFKQLNQLSIYDNQCRDFSNLFKIHCKMNRFWIQGENFQVQSEDISFIVKVPKRSLQYQFGIRSIERIKQAKSISQLKQQHPQIKIFLAQNTEENIIIEQ